MYWFRGNFGRLHMIFSLRMSPIYYTICCTVTICTYIYIIYYILYVLLLQETVCEHFYVNCHQISQIYFCSLSGQLSMPCYHFALHQHHFDLDTYSGLSAIELHTIALYWYAEEWQITCTYIMWSHAYKKFYFKIIIWRIMKI